MDGRDAQRTSATREPLARPRTVRSPPYFEYPGDEGHCRAHRLGRQTPDQHHCWTRDTPPGRPGRSPFQGGECSAPAMRSGAEAIRIDTVHLDGATRAYEAHVRSVRMLRAAVGQIMIAPILILPLGIVLVMAQEVHRVISVPQYLKPLVIHS